MRDLLFLKKLEAKELMRRLDSSYIFAKEISQNKFIFNLNKVNKSY